MQAATGWYATAFETQPYFVEPFYVGFNIAGYELGLIEDEKDVTEKSGNVMTYWAVDDVNTEFDRLIALGASSYEKPQNVGGEIVVAAVKDPWNNVIGLIYNPDFSLDQ